MNQSKFERSHTRTKQKQKKLIKASKREKKLNLLTVQKFTGLTWYDEKKLCRSDGQSNIFLIYQGTLQSKAELFKEVFGWECYGRKLKLQKYVADYKSFARKMFPSSKITRFIWVQKSWGGCFWTENLLGAKYINTSKKSEPLIRECSTLFSRATKKKKSFHTATNLCQQIYH